MFNYDNIMHILINKVENKFTIALKEMCFTFIRPSRLYVCHFNVEFSSSPPKALYDCNRFNRDHELVKCKSLNNSNSELEKLTFGTVGIFKKKTVLLTQFQKDQKNYGRFFSK